MARRHAASGVEGHEALYISDDIRVAALGQMAIQMGELECPRWLARRIMVPCTQQMHLTLGSRGGIYGVMICSGFCQDDEAFGDGARWIQSASMGRVAWEAFFTNTESGNLQRGPIRDPHNDSWAQDPCLSVSC